MILYRLAFSSFCEYFYRCRADYSLKCPPVSSLIPSTTARKCSPGYSFMEKSRILFSPKAPPADNIPVGIPSILTPPLLYFCIGSGNYHIVGCQFQLAFILNDIHTVFPNNSTEPLRHRDANTKSKAKTLSVLRYYGIICSFRQHGSTALLK